MDFKYGIQKHTELKSFNIKDNIALELISKKYRALQGYELLMRKIKLLDSELKSLNIIVSRYEKVPYMAYYEIFVEKPYLIEGFTPSKDQVVVDVGAYIGDTALWYFKKFNAKVIAFEPVPENYEILKYNITLNNAESYITAYNYLIGDGKPYYYEMRGNMAVYTEPDNPHKEPMPLHSYTLDSVHLNKCDLLKIDTEGFECEVIEGAVQTIKQFQPRIIVEVHSLHNLTLCEAILGNLHYRLKYAGKKMKFKPKNMDLVQNLFFDYDYNGGGI